MSEDEIRKEFEAWFALLHPGLYNAKSMFMAYQVGRNAALEAAVKAIDERILWNMDDPGETAIEVIRALKEQSNES